MTEKKQENILQEIGEYKYGFSMPDTSVFHTQKGLNREVVQQISAMKGEPQWMLDFRLRALEHALSRPTPRWGADLSGLNLDDIFFYVKPSQGEGKSWEGCDQFNQNNL